MNASFSVVFEGSEDSEMSEENIRLVVVRHGDSVWSVENRFCGWHDADLSDKGTKYAYEAAQVSVKRQ